MKVSHFALLFIFSVTLDECSSRSPNFVVLFADDMGYGDLASYGHPTQERGRIDELGVEGLRFTHWYSGDSLCTPSRAALLTGRLPVRSGMVPVNGSNARVLAQDSTGGLPQSEITIAEALKEAGYVTGHVGKWHLGINSKTFSDGAHLPYRHGFDFVGHSLPLSNFWPCDEHGEHHPHPDPSQCFVYENDTIKQQPINHDHLTADLVNDAVGFFSRHKDTPFFFYLAFAHLHVSMFTSPNFTHSSLRGVYGDNLREMDWAVGQVIDALKSLSLSNNTLVFFTSDNGPHIELCREGGSAGLLTGGKSQSWEGGIRMPAFAWWPGVITGGRISHAVASTMDIFSTIIDFAGVSLPTDRVIDGKSLRHVLTDPTADSPHEFLFHYCANRLMAVHHGPYKAHFVTQKLAPTNYSLDDCIQGSPKGEIFTDWPCYGPLVTEHDPPLLFHLGCDPSEVYALKASDYQPVLDEINKAVRIHKEKLQPGEAQLGPVNGKLTPCCDPPHCTCNYP